jgi:hypothetical protein
MISANYGSSEEIVSYGLDFYYLFVLWKWMWLSWFNSQLLGNLKKGWICNLVGRMTLKETRSELGPEKEYFWRIMESYEFKIEMKPSFFLVFLAFFFLVFLLAKPPWD